MKTVFISHSSKDEKIVEEFLDNILTGALALNASEIFCTTTDGTKIKSGEDWRRAIQKAIKDAKIIFLIITPNYKESEICMCELGAAWASGASVIPLIHDPIDYESVGVLQEVNQLEKLLDKGSLDRIRDLVCDELDIEPSRVPSDRWSSKRDKFVGWLKRYINRNPFSPPMSRDEFEGLCQSKQQLEEELGVAEEKIERLEEIVKDLKAAKNAVEVNEIMKKHTNTGKFECFLEKCSKIKEYLSKIHPIIVGIIYSSYSGKEIKIESQYYGTEFSLARARDYIDEYYEADWESTTFMQNLRAMLYDLEEFIVEASEDEGFSARYDEKFASRLCLQNFDFWEHVLKVSVRFE